AQYLQQRARKLLAVVENRNPQLAALQDPEPWRRWLLWALPLFAALAAAVLDRIDNPQQVNMLSPPLIGVLAWNLAMYLLLLVAAFAPDSWQGKGLLALLQRRLAGLPVHGRRTGRLRIDVSARFHQQWLQATSRQQLLWFKQLLHLTAAGWAVGLAVSIILGGLVRQYRVGWESTLLDLGQVHAFLSVLFAPVVALLPFDAFSQADLQRMAFASNATIGVAEARRWVWMFLALLALVVVVPRLLLASWAAWRRQRLDRAVGIDLRDPYYVDVLARVSPARVTLGLLARPGRGRDLVLRLLPEAPGRPARIGAARTLLTTSKGDVLRVFDIPPDYQPPAPTVARTGAGAAQAWMQELLGRFRAAQPAGADDLQEALADCDLVLLLPEGSDSIAQAMRLLHWVAQPALVLADAGADAAVLEAYRASVQRSGLAADVLDLDAAAAHWLREPRLLEAIAARLPASKRAGFARLAAAWTEQNEQRFRQAMQLLATLLVRAAREHEEVAGAPVNLRQLVNAGEREASQRARDSAAQALLVRVRAEETATLAELLRLHRLDAPAAPVATARMEEGFDLRQAVDQPQAGMAGAATGAAMGAGIDLLTGGLTLGAAAALGAVIGGGAAYVAAALKNRSAPAGQPQVQLSEEMLVALAESALAGYLAVAHRLAPAAGGLPAAWRSEVVAAVAGRREALVALWGKARASGSDERVEGEIAQELGVMARGVLGKL
ncbi:MAG: putative rane protein, partial [Ramlibacter sp.]|nr:putative rane protein [Ramlibacter sp.]